MSKKSGASGYTPSDAGYGRRNKRSENAEIEPTLSETVDQSPDDFSFDTDDWRDAPDSAENPNSDSTASSDTQSQSNSGESKCYSMSFFLSYLNHVTNFFVLLSCLKLR